jgi:mannose-6-phosphate isomerase-like protein (cupin superfamily)
LQRSKGDCCDCEHRIFQSTGRLRERIQKVGGRLIHLEPAARKTFIPVEASSMKGFVGDIEGLTKSNRDFRRVLYTGHNLQLVLMSIEPGDEIGEEVHEDRDQFFRIEAGEGEVSIDGVSHRVKADDGIIVPQGALHNVKSIGPDALKIYTIYGPPEHIDGTVHQSPSDAMANHEHFDGRTTE